MLVSSISILCDGKREEQWLFRLIFVTLIGVFIVEGERTVTVKSVFLFVTFICILCGDRGRTILLRYLLVSFWWEGRWRTYLLLSLISFMVEEKRTVTVKSRFLFVTFICILCGDRWKNYFVTSSIGSFWWEGRWRMCLLLSLVSFMVERKGTMTIRLRFGLLLSFAQTNQ